MNEIKGKKQAQQSTMHTLHTKATYKTQNMYVGLSDMYRNNM